MLIKTPANVYLLFIFIVAGNVFVCKRAISFALRNNFLSFEPRCWLCSVMLTWCSVTPRYDVILNPISVGIFNEWECFAMTINQTRQHPSLSFCKRILNWFWVKGAWIFNMFTLLISLFLWILERKYLN